MCLVYNYGKAVTGQFVADGVEDERELMHGRKDDFLAVYKVLPQGFATVGGIYDVFIATKSPHVVAQLLVEVNAVGNDNYAVKQRLVSL